MSTSHALADELTAAYATRQPIAVAALGARARLRSGRRRTPSKPSSSRLRRAERPHDRRAQGRLRQQGDVARAQARHAGLGAHVRRHGALRRAATHASLSLGAHVLAEDRAGDRLQAEDAARRRRPPMPAAVLDARRVARARLRDHRLRVSRTGSFSPPTSSPPSACTPR